MQSSTDLGNFQDYLNKRLMSPPSSPQNSIDILEQELSTHQTQELLNHIWWEQDHPNQDELKLPEHQDLPECLGPGFNSPSSDQQSDQTSDQECELKAENSNGYSDYHDYYEEDVLAQGQSESPLGSLPPADPIYQNFFNVSTIEPIMEEMMLINNRLDNLTTDLKMIVSSMSLKKERKQKSMDKRCTFMNTRSGRCKGYFCKSSNKLCYAHFNIVKKSLKNTHFLFGSKNKQ